ncbi:SusC/RagA family TonB-linked outer membrane protein [uncultured Bacteroides sp.]|uniref:SusC/RagA family TonB-linked outer membrane protein n=1 Tax=uncultured Bacteroides sp. TaxID=162156 RepID=UPI002AAA67B1|nr:SusC/RagA family TonB-linked outer membrane protein [uncultured Bacteroides sp.]
MRKTKWLIGFGRSPLWRMVLFFVFMVGICSTYAEAQTQKVKNPLISLDCKNEPMSSVLKKIEQASKYKVLFTYDEIQSYKVTVSFKDKPLNEAVKEVIGSYPLAYKIKNIYISIYSLKTTAERKRIVGKVVDKNGEALPGVNITTDNKTIGGISNVDGNFDIRIPDGETVNVLSFSFIGLKKSSFPFKGDRLRVVMEDDAQAIDEVVVTGLVTHNSNSFTGNASVFKGEDLKMVGRQNLIKSLSILDPTIAIVENTSAGSNPNTMPKIRFRGESSFQGFENIDKSGLMSDPNEPLFILDGYQTTMSTIVDLDMNLIESVTILKDAAAGAIYGSRAANGVIVVKTLQPKEGELRISYGLDMNVNLPDLSSYNLLNAKENLALYDRFGMYRNNDGTLTPAYNQITRWIAQGVDTDWMAQPVRNAVGYKHSLNLSGGDHRMRYGVDLNYSNAPGVMKKSFRTNYGIGIKLSYNYNDKLRFTNHLSVGQTNSKESPYGSFQDYTTINSFYPIKDANGKLYKYYYYEDQYGEQNVWGNSNNTPINPLYEASVGNDNKDESQNINNNFAMEWRLLPSFRINGMISYTKSTDKATSFLSPNSATYTEYSASSSTSTEEKELLKGKYTYAETFQERLESNLVATWSKNMGVHFATASVGGSMADTKSTLYGFTAQGFGEEDAAEPAYAQGYEKGGTPSNSEGHTRMASLFASANYAYDSRYLFDFSYRLDGSSQFGTEKKVAPFYSLGVGWNMHNELFIKKLKFVNMLKLRATYGEVGSVNFSPYQAKDMYQYTKSDRYDGNIGVILRGLGNENLRWQSTRSYELGAKVGIFNRFDFSASIYNKLTSDMVLPVTTPPSVGFNSYIENLGRMRNKGYEISMRAFLLKKAGLNVSVFASATHNTNKILSISSALESYNKAADSSDGYSDNEYKQVSHTFLTKYEEGQSSTAIYAVRSLGIDPMTGEELFLTKEGKTTLKWNASDKMVVGDTEPTMRGTFGTNVGWNGLFLNATFSYSLGGQIYNSTLVNKVENSNKFKNMDKRVLTETWQKPGDVVKYKANLTKRYSQYYTYASSRFVQDQDYLQLAALSLQYELPKKMIRPLRMKSVRLSFNMSDIFYLSTVKRERGTDYPYARSFSFGLRTNF